MGTFTITDKDGKRLLRVKKAQGFIDSIAIMLSVITA